VCVIEYSGGRLGADRGGWDQRESSIDEASKQEVVKYERGLTDGCEATSSLVPILPTKLSTLYTKHS